jgi:hypothetical protein
MSVRDIIQAIGTASTVAIAAAAVVGFAIMRVFRTGLEDVGVAKRDGNGARRQRSSNADTTTGGGA